MTDTDTTDDVSTDTAAATTDAASSKNADSLLDAASRHSANGAAGTAKTAVSDADASRSADTTDNRAATSSDTKAADPDALTVTLKRSDIPDNFIKDGEFAAGSLVKAWKDANEEVRELRKAKAPADVPDKPDDYVYALTEDQQQMAEKVLQPGEDGSEDPVLADFRQFAHDRQMPKGLYGDIVRWYIETTAPLIPDPVDQKAEISKLGTHAQQIIDATDAFGEQMKANGLFDDAMAKEFRITASSAQGIKMLNAIRDHYGEPPVPVQLHQQAVQTGDASDLDAKMGDIARKRAAGELTEDQANREAAALDAEYEKIYGTDPARTSIVRQ